MERYQSIKEAVTRKVKAYNDISVWTGEIGNSSPKIIPKGEIFKIIDEYKDKRDTVFVIDYRGQLYYCIKDIFWSQQDK